MLDKLQKLAELNERDDWENHRIYRYLLNEEIFVAAYENMKSKVGNMTKGTDGKTLDGFSIRNIEKTIEALRIEQFNPMPARRKYIPKRDGKLRPLGIPAVMDKVVQECVLMVLECIYENGRPYFKNTNHGFREKRGTHTALKDVCKWSGTKWFIEGDIKGFFDNINHHVLIEILRRRIKDEKFIRLIWKFLRAGYMDNGVFHNTKIGTPQGGLISPILANIYLHDFDVQVEKWIAEYTKGKRRRLNLEWRKLNRLRLKLEGLGDSEENKAKLREVKLKLKDMPTVDVNDPNIRRLRYVRYADDWLMGIVGPKAMAEEIKEKARLFLSQELKLTLHQEKTLITSALEDRAKFLGFRIGRRDLEAKVSVITTKHKKTHKRRTAQSEIILEVDDKEILKKMKEGGYCDSNYMPISKGGLIGMEEFQIVQHYNALKRGLFNYYRPIVNKPVLARVDYILRYSLLKTLSGKHKTSLAVTIKRKGLNARVKWQTKNGEKTTQYWAVTMAQHGKSLLEYVQDPSPVNVEKLMERRYIKLSKSKVDWPCCVCGSNERVEMHHVRKLWTGGASVVKGFNKILGAINRKQIPVCKKCHVEIHHGKYDGIKLSDLNYIPVESVER